MNYLTEEEMKFNRKSINRQIALGLKTCETIEDACKLLDDIREHERRILEKEALK